MLMLFYFFFSIYLDNNLVIGDKSTHIKNSSLDFLELELRFFGAHITKSWSSDVSHVMCDKRYGN